MNGNQIKGFVKYNEIEYGFFFADEELLLFPCNEEQRQKDTPNLFDMFIAGRPQPRKVIRKILISGTTSDGKNVIFQVSEDPGNDNGYLYFRHHPQKPLPRQSGDICHYLSPGAGSPFPMR